MNRRLDGVLDSFDESGLVTLVYIVDVWRVEAREDIVLGVPACFIQRVRVVPLSK